MRTKIFYSNSYADPEVIGAVLLVLIAFVAFAAINSYVNPIPLPDNDLKADIVGFLDTKGNIVLEHVGGEQISNFEVFIDDILVYKSQVGEDWCLGERYLFTATSFDSPIRVDTISNQGRRIPLFDATLSNQNVHELQVILVGGTGDVTPESGEYLHGTVVHLLASPGDGFRVKEWIGADYEPFEGSHSNRVTMNEDKTVQVLLEPLPPVTYTLSTLITGGDGIIHPSSGIYEPGFNVDLYIEPAEGYRVLEWIGAYHTPFEGSQSNNVTMNEDKLVEVVLEPIPEDELFYILTTEILYGQGTIHPASGIYHENELVTLYTAPAEGYLMGDWSGTEDDPASGDLINTVLMSENKTVTVFFLYDEPEGGEPIINDPLSFTSLLTNTIDEDIICFANPYGLESMNSYIFSWMRNGNPFANVLYSFDTDSETIVEDYSGNENNGTISDAEWTSDGHLGGGYTFDGMSFISMPFCFDSPYLNDFTIETWVKTSQESAALASMNRGKYWELGLANGYPSFSTYGNGEVDDLTASTFVDDGSWHHITASYDASSGEGSLYIDGILDVQHQSHSPGTLIGDGSSPEGYLGKGDGASRETIFSTGFESIEEMNHWEEDAETWGGGGSITWENYFFDDFEYYSWGTWGNWNDGGGDCNLYSGGTYSYDGVACPELMDNSGWSSSTYTDRIYAQSGGYAQMSIDFWWQPVSMEDGEDLQVLYWDGSYDHLLESYVVGYGEYDNNEWYHSLVIIDNTQYGFTNDARFVLRCDASGNYDYVYVDHIYINVTTGSRVDYDFDRWHTSTVSSHSGSYSLGGTGDFDPEFAFFNRTLIDLEGYIDIELSVWYSFKNTESDDDFGLYYKHEGSWEPIFVVSDPELPSGQSDWEQVTMSIPETIDVLELQFRWSTSSTAEHVVIDDLQITGIPPGGSNYIGLLDEFKIYPRLLSAEQIYQNYVSTREQGLNCSVIVAGETVLGDTWQCLVTSHDGSMDVATIPSNSLQLGMYQGGE